MGQWIRWTKRALIWGAAEEASISVTKEGLLVSVIIWWLNASTQSRAWRGTQMAYWWWLVQKQTTDCSPTLADADIFIQLAQLTIIKENETLRLVCMWRRREKNQDERPESQFSHLFWSASQQFLRFYTNIRKEKDNQVHTVPTHTHTYRHTFWLTDTHKYLCWTEASFPALLYLMHIKYHFPEKIPQCLVFVGCREILSWLPSTGYYQKLDFINDSSYVFS